MNKKDVDSIAWLIKQAKDNNQPKPIVFLGAGASISAGIPGTAKIIEDILKNFANKPEIKKLDIESRKDYYKIMTCLNTTERHKLLRSYITNEDVKINVTHIYLAQMLNEGFIDYVLTVNFDDLFLRACSLFNFIPPVYDISILKDFTTTTLSERSVAYLHGQHHGFWLLNTGEELEKVKEYIRTVFDRICNNRTWIVVGYSGEDTVFDQISRLDNFTNELFWIGYNENIPSPKVQEKLLNKPNSNAAWVSGYDSDSFFLKLHSVLGMKTPDIFNKPFSFLKGIMGNVRDINEISAQDEHKKLFEAVKERYKISVEQINAALEQYEKNNPSGARSKEIVDRDQIKKVIVEAIAKEDYQLAPQLYSKINQDDGELKFLLSNLYYNWGLSLSDIARKRNNLSLFEESVDKAKTASELNPQNAMAFTNWGTGLVRIGVLKNEQSYLYEAEKKLEAAIQIDDSLGPAYNNLSNVLIEISKTLPVDQQRKYLSKAEDAAKKAVERGRPPYNLACIYSILKQKQKALKNLEESLKTKIIDANYVINDKDWQDYLNDDDFKNLIAKFKS